MAALQNTALTDVCSIDDEELSLDTFMNYFMVTANKHNPVVKFTINAP